jgi:hypothetical protein
MKPGDEVMVQFVYSDHPERGVLVRHSDDWKVVTIRTDAGVEWTGLVSEIQEVSLFK